MNLPKTLLPYTPSFASPWSFILEEHTTPHMTTEQVLQWLESQPGLLLYVRTKGRGVSIRIPVHATGRNGTQHGPPITGSSLTEAVEKAVDQQRVGSV